VKGKVIGGSVAAVLLAAAALIAPWEGLRTDPYRDIVGVWTVCYGETNVEMRRYTPAECEAMLRESVARYAGAVAKCINRPLAVHQWAAVTSWAYNVGPAAACNSTLVRQVNAGEPPEVWCRQLLRWNKAGGRTVRGLTLRRQAEYRVCIGESEE
jgi:lysozyme